MPAKQSLTKKFADQLRREIHEKGWGVDDPLPSERTLSVMFGVSRVTVRRSLKRLVDEQLIVTEPGRGHFLRKDVSPPQVGRDASTVLFFFRPARSGPALDMLHTRIFNGAAAVARERGLSLYLNCQPPDQFVETLLDMWGKSLRGILMEWPQKHVVDMLMEKQVPMVFVESDLPGCNVTSVVQDDASGVRKAMAFARAQGHRNMGLVLFHRSDTHSRNRLSGYREFLLREGLSYQPASVGFGTLDADGGYKAACGILDQQPRPTVLLVAYRRMLQGVWRAIHERGLQVPQDLSLVTWGEPDSLEPPEGIPPLSYVSWDREEMGRLAMLALEERIQTGYAARMEVKIETTFHDLESVRKVIG